MLEVITAVLIWDCSTHGVTFKSGSRDQKDIGIIHHRHRKDTKIGEGEG